MFARWCGVAPVAVSSGEGDGHALRHRLDPHGNRTVTAILHVLSVVQARCQDHAKAFPARNRAAGKTSKEARRAHQRRLADRVIRRMRRDHARQTAGQATTPGTHADLLDAA
ncbi:MAG: transposase [Acetobacteraceae bacterium]|nr:transposase [Acetobacteraceae bacterium]